MRRDDPEVEPVPVTRKLPYDANTIISALTPLVLPRRLDRMQAVIDQRTNNVVAVLEGLSDPHNVSAVLRSCDAFGVQRTMVIETDQPMRASKTVSKGAERWLTVEKHARSGPCFAALKQEGYAIWVATMGANHSVEALRQTEKLALVLGNEHRGPSSTATDFAEGTFAIPMLGFVESLNVSVAAAITLQAVRRGRSGDLSAAEKRQLLARYLFQTVRDPVEAVERNKRREQAQTANDGAGSDTQGSPWQA